MEPDAWGRWEMAKSEVKVIANGKRQTEKFTDKVKLVKEEKATEAT